MSSRAFSSRKIGITDSQGTARRVLEFTDDLTHPSAIPPLSPPELDDDSEAATLSIHHLAMTLSPHPLFEEANEI